MVFCVKDRTRHSLSISSLFSQKNIKVKGLQCFNSFSGREKTHNSVFESSEARTTIITFKVEGV